MMTALAYMRTRTIDDLLVCIGAIGRMVNSLGAEVEASFSQWQPDIDEKNADIDKFICVSFVVAMGVLLRLNLQKYYHISDSKCDSAVEKLKTTSGGNDRLDSATLGPFNYFNLEKFFEGEFDELFDDGFDKKIYIEQVILLFN
jgi:hypothetical protein